METPSTSTD